MFLFVQSSTNAECRTLYVRKNEYDFVFAFVAATMFHSFRMTQICIFICAFYICVVVVISIVHTFNSHS